MIEFRCPNHLHGLMTEAGLLEVSCKSRWCGKEPGVVVLHRYNVETGKLVETIRFKQPLQPQGKE